MDDNQESQIHGDDGLEEDNLGTPRVLKEEEKEKNDNKVSAEKNGRLCFKLLKLKYPNTESFLQQHPPPPPPKEELLVSSPSPSPTTRICNICNRGFGSGKALGGHMRMHVQARNKELLEKLNNATTANTAHDIIAKTHESFSIMEEGEPTCYVCKKTFLSMKSLFGHMRSHPERDWRGIQPPTTTPTDHKYYNNCCSSSSLSLSLSDEKLDPFPVITATTSEEVFVDLSESLSSWRVTGKRGRKSTDSADDSGLPLDIDEDAVFGLMTLANVDPRQASNKSDPTYCNSTMDARKKLRIDDEARSSREVLHNKIEAKGKGKPVVEEETALEVPLFMKWNLFGYEEESPREYYRHNSIDSSELDFADKIVGETMMMSNKRKTRKVKLVELEALGGDQSQKQVYSVTPNRYICSLCNRSFPTHQALGGHRSSHNKVKYIQQQTLDESVSADDSAAENYGHYANPTTTTTTTQMDEEAVLGPTTHQCKICDRIFPTGQALGGHKRCHWNGTVEMQSSQVTSPEGEAKAQSSQATSPGEASQTGRRNLEFDLNELPAMEVEEGIVESIYMVAA
ncbi:uncharacterized protein LOC142641387 [Castanea sativa]|uniref:uncharacterized protein LOC142641387 n=1 Tax=Castanea sativa TaxID=21020 RepID=UPI003F64DCCE